MRSSNSLVCPRILLASEAQMASSRRKTGRSRFLHSLSE